MSALVVLECNSCAAVSPWPFPSTELAREQAREFGWSVNAPGAEDVDYCPKCSGPAGPQGLAAEHVPPSRLDVARAGITQLRDSLAAISLMTDLRPAAVLSVANLARVRADELLRELAS